MYSFSSQSARTAAPWWTLTAFLVAAATADAQVCSSKTYGTASLFVAGEKLVDGNADVLFPKVSADGTLKAFHSAATNYQGDSLGVLDVFLAWSYSARAQRISVGHDGSDANDDSFLADVSGDGQWITFASKASNLIPTDTNGFTDIFLYQVSTGTLERISEGVSGEANGPSSSPAISQNGRFIAFHSAATNLIGSDTNGVVDVFRHDRVTGLTTRVSVGPGDTQGNGDSTEATIDGSGDLIAFTSLATNLVTAPDLNGVEDVFAHRVSTGATQRISVSSGGTDGNGASSRPALSLSGGFLSYTSRASNLLPGGADSNGKADIFLENLTTSSRLRVSVGLSDIQANDDSFRSSVSNNGAVVFASAASNLIGANDQNGVVDIFVRVPTASLTYRASVDSNGVEADAASLSPDITADGCDVTFASAATNLIALRPTEANTAADLFCHRHEGDCPNLCTAPEIEDISSTVILEGNSGPPLGMCALFSTHLNDAPLFQFLFIKPYDATGSWSHPVSIPGDPTLRGLVISMRAYALPAGGGSIELTNSSFLAIQN